MITIENDTLLPEKLYKRFTRSLPLFCVDIIAKSDKGIILGKRKNEPAKGQYWLPGGRLHFRESFEDCAKRKMKEETGFDVKVKGFANLYSMRFDNPHPYKSISLVAYSVIIGGSLDLRNSDLEKVIFVNRVEDWMHPYMKRILTGARAFSKSPNLLLQIKSSNYLNP